MFELFVKRMLLHQSTQGKTRDLKAMLADENKRRDGIRKTNGEKRTDVQKVV